jgi:hypothetical protein
LNETAGSITADASGNRQDGVLTIGAAWTSGREGSAVALDGVSGLVSVEAFDGSRLAELPVTATSFSAWIKPAAAATARPFATAIARTHEDFAFQDFWLGLADGAPACTIHSPSAQGAFAAALAPADTWTHLACTYATSGAIRLYVNGFLAASFTSTETIGPIPTRLLIGASETTTVTNYFPGAIDDVRLYDRTLTASEIAALATP